MELNTKMESFKLKLAANISKKNKDKIKYVMLWLDRLIKLPLHLGGHTGNYYPDTNHIGISKLNIPFKRTKSSPEFRIKTWTRIAKSHPTLRHFYQDSPLESFKASPLYRENMFHRQAFEDLYLNGTATIENFCVPDDHKTIVDLFEKEVDSVLAMQRHAPQIRVREKAFNEMFHRYTRPIERVLFNKVQKQQEYDLKSCAVKNGESPYKSTLYHQDTFVPAFKLFYFPTDVVTNPYCYQMGSHKIDEQYLKNGFLTASDETENIVDKFDYSGYNEKKFYVKANTMVISCVHGFHKRFWEKKTGVRKLIMVSYFGTFTFYDLFANYLRHGLFNK